MKKLLFSYISLFTLLICYVLPSNAQQAFYIYRNDGCINTFITTEIDSMTYSRLDLDSVTHDEYVVHEVYTPDSIYRIPIELIDSIGFVTPKTVYQPGVRVLEGEMRNYIISRNELTLVFQSSTPNSLLPHVGDKLVTTEADDVITNAFVGQVSEVNTTSAGIEVVCEPVDLTEVFETYYGIIRKTDEPASARRKSIADGFYSTNGTRTLSPGKLTLDLLNTHNTQITYSPDDELSFSLNNARAAISLTPTIDYNAYVIVNKAYGINVSVTAIGNYTVEEILALSGSIQFGGDVPLFEKAIPIPEALIDVYFEFGIFNTMTGKFSVDQTWTQKYRHVFHWEWSSKGHQTLKNVNDFKPVSSTHNGKIALNGNWGAGAYGRVGIAFIATSSLDIAEIGLRVEGGLMAEGTYVPYKRDEEYAKKSTDLYNQIKDREVTSYFYYGLSGEAKLFKWSVSHEVPNFFNLPLNKRWPIATVRDVPLFSDTKLIKDISGTYYASANVEGVVHKTDVGFALINKYNNEDATYTYTINDYQGPQTVINASFIDKPTSNKYIVYPLVKYMDMELIAEPSAPKAPTVTTGKVTNIDCTSAETYGNVKGLEPDNNIDIGICYSTYNPVDAYGTHVSSGNKNDGDFNVKLSGLIENTTYYYCAYAYNNGEYYYGKTSSFKTKKKEDPDPIAITGEHKKEQTTSATIECTYKYVPNNADCGYYISKSYYENTARSNRISGGIEWDKVSVGRYEGTKEISLDNLMPDEEYQYYAYISVGNEDVATGAIKSFTTKTPKAQLLGEPQASITSATVGYGFENVPEGGTCQLILLKVGDPLQNAQYISVPSTSNGNYTFAGLEASTSYQYMARIEYKTRKWDSGTGSFTTQAMPTPVVITGGHYNETLNSATIECTYKQIPAGTDCGYYLRGQKGSTLISSISKSIGNVEGTKSINLSDLKAGTTYFYQAYAQYQGREYLGSENSFQTLTPNAVTGPYSNVTSNKASIVCGYFNVPEDAETGVILSYDGEEHEMPYNYGEGEHNIDINGLYPGTSYSYSAYIKYDDETYQGETKHFTTLTPSAYVGEATNVKEKSAQFEYGFRNVPDGGTCHIALQQEGGETYDYSVSDAEQDIFQLSGLQPSTTYTYWSYVDYYGETWNSNSLQFTTKTPPTPVATTGDFSNVTMNSATVTCTYENVPEGGVCGVEYTWNGGSTKQTIGSSNGTQSITLSGLNPATSYTYCAYIEANGQTYYGSDKSFTTDSPSLAGTWNCTITKGTSTESWRITLTEDHKGSAVKTDGSSNTFEASWGVGADGKASVGFAYVISTSSYYSYQTYNLNGQVDNLMSPSQIQGEGWYEIGNAIAETVVPLTFNMSK